MATIPLNFGGGGGTGSDDVTATIAQVLAGFTAITHDSDDEPIAGSMINRGAVSQSLNTSTTSYTVPQGYHSGSGKVSITTQEKTITPTTSAQNVTPDSGKVLSKVTVNAISTQTKTITPSTSAQNITPDSGKYLSKVTVNAISTQEKTASATTSAQAITPDSGKYLSKVNIRALSQTNLASGNILRGKTISINNGSTNVWSVAGNNAALKCVSGSATTGSTRITVDGKSLYYVDINPGITPVQIVSYAGANYTNMRIDNVMHGTDIVEINVSSLPKTSSQVRLVTVSSQTTVYYYIFGY